MLDRLRKHPFTEDVAALLAGGLYSLAFAPFDFWALGIIAIVLLLVVVSDTTLKRGLIRFYLFSLGMYGIGASWLYVSVHEHGQAPVLLAGTMIALFIMAISLLALVPGYFFLRFSRPRSSQESGLSLVLGFSILWVVREWLYTWFLTGFPWLLAGYGHLDTPLAGYAPFFGILGVSFFVVFSSGLIFTGLTTQQLSYRIVAMVGLTSIWLVGFALSKLELVKAEGPGVSVSVVQGNIDQKVKWQRDMVLPIVRTYLELSRDEWGRELIVWPEAAITILRENAADLLGDLDARGKATGTTLIMGIPDRDDAGNHVNAAIAIGMGQGRYIKRHLVPFGEYMPLEDLLRGLVHFFDLPMSNNRPGAETQLLLQAAELKLAVSICYEIVFPDLVRSNPEVPDLLLTISNDTWFGDSIGPLQHMQMARMRALENGRYLIRGTNNGVTALVDYRGRVINRLPQFEAGVLRGEVRKMTGTTIYNRFGDAAILILLVVAWMGQWAWQRRYSR